MERKNDIFEANAGTFQAIPVRRFNSLVSFLISAGVHLSLLVVLTILSIVAAPISSLDLEFSVASSASPIELETFELESVADDLPEVNLDEPVMVASAKLGFASDAPVLQEFGVAVGTPVDGESEKPSSGGGAVAGNKGRRKGSFFGTHAYGDEFVFVVDSSRSMLSPCGFRYGRTRFEVAKMELMRSLRALEDDQEFCVFFFGARTRVMFDSRPQLVKATPKQLTKLERWMTTLSPGAGTDPRRGVLQALRLKPDAIFLLSDGEFNGRAHNLQQIPGNPTVEQIIQRYLKHSIPIHTIAFEDVHNRRRLRNIATITGGTHKYIGSQSNEALLVLDLESQAPDDLAYALQSIIDTPSQLSNDDFVHRAARRLTQLLHWPKTDFRNSAHFAMLALAEQLDADTSTVHGIEEIEKRKDADSARKAWTAVWKSYFSQGKSEAKLTRL